MDTHRQDPKSQIGLYSIKTIAGLTGFNPNLLRTWGRRYDILDPVRKPSGHRLYTEDDRRVLMAVRSYMDQGRSIGEVASIGKETLLSRVGPPSANPPPSTCSVEPCSPTLRRFVDQILDAAQDLDSVKMESILDGAFDLLAPEVVFQTLMVRVTRKLGDLWGQGKISVAHEHLTSEIFRRRVYQWWGNLPKAASEEVSAIVACLPDEQHELGALLVTCHLVSEGINARYLGHLPLLDLELACRTLKPKIVMLSVARPELFAVHCENLSAVISRNCSSVFVLGGRGAADKSADIVRIGATFWASSRPLSDLSTLL